MNDLNTISVDWQEEWQQVRRTWQRTEPLWNDLVGEHFEREFWQPLESGVSTTQREMEALISVIAQARRSIQ